MFHPDKHKGDKIEAANMLFDRAKKAYEGVNPVNFSSSSHRLAKERVF